MSVGTAAAETTGFRLNEKNLPRILVVDDELPVLLALRRSLRDSFDVHTAFDVDSAMQLIKSQSSFSVVVSDMRMPGKSGLSLLAQVLDIAPMTQRIMLTGDKERETIMGAVKEGQVCRFLSKPCAPEELREALDEGVRRHQEAVRTQQIGRGVGPMTIEAMLHSITGGDDAVRAPVLRTQRVSHFLDAIDRLATPIAAAFGVGLHISCERADAEIFGDPDQLSLALSALLTEAVKRVGAGGDLSLFVDTDPEDGGWAAYILEKPREGNRARAQAEADNPTKLDAVRHVIEMHGGALHHRGAGDGLLTRIVMGRMLEPDFV